METQFWKSPGMEREGCGSDDIISLDSDDDGDIVVVVPPQRRPAGGLRADGLPLRVPARTERRLRAAEVALRFAACLFALAAAVLLKENKETHDFFGLFVKVARYTDMPSLVVLVNTSLIVASYNFLQGGRCLMVMSTVRGRPLITSKPMASAIFFCDQVMSYVALSALAGALVAGMISKLGQAQFGWTRTAQFYKRFSMQAAVAINCALVAVVAMVAVSALSAFNLFRLYGAGKATKI